MTEPPPSQDEQLPFDLPDEPQPTPAAAPTAPAAETHPSTAAATPPPAELLLDGIYRDKEVGRWTRLALLLFALVAVFAAAGVSSSAVAVISLLAIAVVLILIRASSGRQRLVVRPGGLVAVRRIGSVTVPWGEVASAGSLPAPPPLAKVESVLAIRTTSGRELRVSCLRDAVDRRTGVAPRVAELAASLVARAAWSTTPEP